jgi:hypothetical protein
MYIDRAQQAYARDLACKHEKSSCSPIDAAMGRLPGAVMGGLAPGRAQKTPEIKEALEFTNAQAKRLFSTVQELLDRIGPVVMDVPTMEQQTGSPYPSMNSHAGREIVAIGIELANLTDRVSDNLRRLAL